LEQSNSISGAKLFPLTRIRAWQEAGGKNHRYALKDKRKSPFTHEAMIVESSESTHEHEETHQIKQVFGDLTFFTGNKKSKPIRDADEGHHNCRKRQNKCKDVYDDVRQWVPMAICKDRWWNDEHQQLRKHDGQID
jgi:hypothetical protein